MNYSFIAIEGNIGAGKTSLAKLLCNDLNGKLILEQFKDNPFLPKFYENNERYAFPLEMSFLAARYKQLKTELANYGKREKIIVSDYYFIKSLIFAGNSLKKDEFELYKQFFFIIHEKIPPPEVLVYLNVSTSGLLKNIKKRGRKYEQNIKQEYLKAVENQYFKFLNNINNLKVLIIDIENQDFVRNEINYSSVKDIILNKKHNPGINKYKL